MKPEFKIITYNIDGLPESLDLNELPIIFKPIAWIYKLIKNTSIVKINDNEDTSKKILHISKCLEKSNADIIGVQEDFNYHNELMTYLYNYDIGKYTGSFDLSKLFLNTEWLSYFPFPRFKADGMNIIVNNNTSEINNEDIISWNNSYGYFNHANDLLTHKGFRFYNVTVNNIFIDVYIVHMDADFYHPEKCPNVDKDIKARKSQIDQLLDYIYKRHDEGIFNPIIIMGDTNSYNKYEWDLENINYFVNALNCVPEFECKEAIPENYSDCDRIFFINNDKYKYKINIKKCYFDMDFNKEIGRVSDHKPLVAIFDII